MSLSHQTVSKYRLPHRAQLFQSGLIIAAGLLVFWPVLHGDWIWDDDTLITKNTDLHDYYGLWRIWLAAPNTDYWPLTWTVLWIEWHLWGIHSFPYHAVSLALHLLSGFLVWRLFAKLGLRWAWLGGLIFVIHPLTVESVAWNSEIKNTLSLPFFLLSLNAFIDADQDKTWRTYSFSLLLYLAAMLSKSSVVMLPVVLLLYCWWKRGQISWWDIRKTTPYFIISLILGLITLYLQLDHVPEIDEIRDRSIDSRLIVAGVNFLFYFGKFLIPIGLLPLYPQWSLDPPTLIQLLALPSVIFLLWIVWIQNGLWVRHILLGLGFFFLNLLPVAGLVHMAYLNASSVADHFTYIPIIGLIGIVVLGLETMDGSASMFAKNSLKLILTLYCSCLMWQSHLHAGLFKNSDALWTSTIARCPTNWLPHSILASALAQTPGRLPDAINEYEIALQLHPGFAQVENNLGNLLLRVPGRLPDAILHFRNALLISPNFAKAHNNLGIALAYTPSHLPDAISELRKAIRLDPKYAEAHHNLGTVLLSVPGRTQDALKEYELSVILDPTSAIYYNDLGTVTGKSSEAIKDFRSAIQLDPLYAAAHYNLANALAGKPDQIQEALSEYRKALLINPDYAEAYNDLGCTLMYNVPGHLLEAIPEFESALRINPSYAVAHNNLGVALLRSDNLSEALSHFQTALNIQPNFAEAHYDLGMALLRLPGHQAEAVSQFKTALRIKPDLTPAQEILEHLGAGK